MEENLPSCSLRTFSTKNCDQSAFVSLKNCTRQTAGHLRVLKVPQKFNNLTEYQLILARVGKFEAAQSDNQHQVDFISVICETHRKEFGLGFVARKKCLYPEHARSSKRKVERGIDLEMSRWIHNKFQQVVPVGSGICKACRISYRDERSKTSELEVIVEEDAMTIDDEQMESVDASTSTPQDDLTRASRATRNKQPYTDVFKGVISESSSSNSEVENFGTPGYEPTPRITTGLRNLNNFIAGGRVSPINFRLTKPLSDSAKSTQFYIKRKAKETVDFVLESIAPGQSNDLLQEIVDPAEEQNDQPKELQTLIKLYNDAEHWMTKQQILSIFAKDYPVSTLLELIPGLTHWRISQARKRATEVGPGVDVQRVKTTRQKMPVEKVQHFLDYISSPHLLQDVAYGTRNLKLSTGEKLEVPNTVRTVIHSRIIKMYQQYCNENNMQPLQRSTLYQILKVCSTSKQKSLSGLDNIANEGSSAFEELRNAVITLSSLGFHDSWKSKMVQRLKNGKDYIKGDYSLHIQSESECADHCLAFALSASDGEFKKECRHQHLMKCDRCEDLKSLLDDLQNACYSPEIVFSYPEQKEELVHSVTSAVDSISEWRSHIVRGVIQEKAKTDIMESLTPNQVLIVMDFAMKYMPIAFRESQSGWFGKKGISWHISACITRKEGQEHQVHTFVHTLDACKQDWHTVCCLALDVLKQMKAMDPELTEAFMRSDNAGCYHSAALIINLAALSKESGIEVKQYDFSESQKGKDICDRKIAPLKANAKYYVAEGKDVHNSVQLKHALESNGGVRGCYIASVAINTPKALPKYAITGISAFTNFQFFDDGRITVWKAYKTGPGRTLGPNLGKPLTPQDVTLIKNEDFSTPSVEFGCVSNVRMKDFSCSEHGCTKMFFTDAELAHHMDVGKHDKQVQNETQFDHIARQWADMLSTAQAGRAFESAFTYSIDEIGWEESGWALKKSKKSVRFSEKVKVYLTNLFYEGEKTKKKHNPADVSKEMKRARNSEGKVFNSDEWLTEQQITGFFSRLTAANRIGTPGACSTDEDDISAAETLIKAHELMKEVVEDLTVD